MYFFQIIIIAVVQGVTEFLPVSSSGHLVLIENFMSLDFENYTSFVVLLHLATLLAVIIYFRSKLYDLFRAVFSAKETVSRQFILKLVIGTLPLVVIVLSMNNLIDLLFQNVALIFVFMFLTGLLFLIGEKFYQQKSVISNDLSYKQALLIGLFQSMAIIPGISRSGITLLAGLFTGVSRAKAAEFSFLLAIPAILGAGVYSFREIHLNFDLVHFIGFCISFIVAYLTISIFMKLYKYHTLKIFAVYLLIFACVGGIITVIKV